MHLFVMGWCVFPCHELAWVFIIHFFSFLSFSSAFNLPVLLPFFIRKLICWHVFNSFYWCICLVWDRYIFGCHALAWVLIVHLFSSPFLFFSIFTSQFCFPLSSGYLLALVYLIDSMNAFFHYTF